MVLQLHRLRIYRAESRSRGLELPTVVKFMPVGFALISADQSAHGLDEAIIMALTYRSFPAETLNCILKVVPSLFAILPNKN